MNRLILTTAVLVLIAFFAGCAKPCFYQAGKTTEQGEHDLQQCIREAETYGYAGAQEAVRPATLISLCMQARGYEYRDADKLPQNCTRISVVTPFGDYWVADGLGMMPNDHPVVSGQRLQKSNPEPPKPQAKRRIKYRVLKDPSGELVKDASGNFVFEEVALPCSAFL
ncbi:MAG: hypothetical protein ACYTEK_18555 [Planctomycetota bacterium]|jgi:hypothetical protein